MHWRTKHEQWRACSIIAMRGGRRHSQNEGWHPTFLNATDNTRRGTCTPRRCCPCCRKIKTHGYATNVLSGCRCCPDIWGRHVSRTIFVGWMAQWQKNYGIIGGIRIQRNKNSRFHRRRDNALNMGFGWLWPISLMFFGGPPCIFYFIAVDP